jgi:hypothetical protein
MESGPGVGIGIGLDPIGAKRVADHYAARARQPIGTITLHDSDGKEVHRVEGAVPSPEPVRLSPAQELAKLRAENADLTDACRELSERATRSALEAADLKAAIGQPPIGSHPDEANPRAATWHAERLNWIAEVDGLRVQITGQAEKITSLTAELEAQDARIEKLTADLRGRRGTERGRRLTHPSPPPCATSPAGGSPSGASRRPPATRCTRSMPPGPSASSGRASAPTGGSGWSSPTGSVRGTGVARSSCLGSACDRRRSRPPHKSPPGPAIPPPPPAEKSRRAITRPTIGA